MTAKRERFMDEHSMFSISQPGYYFSEVESTIEEYKRTIKELSSQLESRTETINQNNQDIQRLNESLFDIHLKLSSRSQPGDFTRDEIDDALSDLHSSRKKIRVKNHSI